MFRVCLGFALTIIVLLGHASAVDTCDCTSEDCKVLVDVSIQKGCADSWCVGGHPVPGGTGNPCINVALVDDGTGALIRKEVQSFGCCRVATAAADCALFAPKPKACQAATCVETFENGVGTGYGFCEYERDPVCCATMGDCPKKDCYDVVDCKCPNSGTGLLFTEKAGSQHKNVWEKRNAHLLDESTCTMQCEYKKRDDCCLKNADCKCEATEIASCGRAGECICFPACGKTTCKVDADCFDAFKDKAIAKGPCWRPDCDSSGVCTIVYDTNTDLDGDGVKCLLDCDDNDATQAITVWCPVEEPVNEDNDEFLKCGTVYKPVCTTQAAITAGTACEFGTPFPTAQIATCLSVDASDTTRKVLTACCDCCDAFVATSDNTPDVTITCQADCDKDGKIDCGGDSTTACVATGTTCAEWDGASSSASCGAPTPPADCIPTADQNDGTSCWIETPPTPPPAQQQIRGDIKPLDAFCDECPQDPNADTPLKICYLDCDADSQPICSGTDAAGNDVDNVVLCCLEMRGATGLYPFIGGAATNVAKCCEAIVSSDCTVAGDGTIDISTCGLNGDVDSSQFSECAAANSVPLIKNVCECPAGYITTAADHTEFTSDPCGCDPNGGADSHIIECSRDKDGDCAQDCSVREFCTTAATCEDVVDDVAYVTPDQTGKCDCDDNDEDKWQLLGCGTDADGDGFAACGACQNICAGDTCPDGTIRLIPKAPTPPPQAVQTGVKGLASKFAPKAAPSHKNNKRATCTPPLFETGVLCPADKKKRQVQTCTQSICDCCDLDKYVFPGSPYCSVNKTLCATTSMLSAQYDYDCDGCDKKRVVCEDFGVDDVDVNIVIDGTGDDKRYIRTCKDQGNGGAFHTGVFEDDGTMLGECKLNGADCERMSGYCPEEKKRGLGDGGIKVDAPVECNELTNPFGDPLAPGTCFEFLESCVKSGSGANTMCHCDCDICVLVSE